MPRLIVGFRFVPLECLAGDGGDALEVPVAVQEGQPPPYGRGSDHEVESSGTAVLSALGEGLLYLPGAVVDRHPAEDQARMSSMPCDRSAAERAL